MKFSISNNRLILEGIEQNEKIVFTTQIEGKDQKKIETNREWVKELIKQEREWKISYPETGRKSYVRIGQINNLSFAKDECNDW